MPSRSTQYCHRWQSFLYIPVCVCVCVCVCVWVLVTQLCPTLCDPMGCSPPGSTVHGILQARILEWVDIPFSRGSSRLGDWTWISAGLLHCMQILYHLSHQGTVFHCECVPYLLYLLLFSATVSSAAMNVGVQVSLCDPDFVSFIYTQKWDLDHIVVVFLIFRDFHTVFPSAMLNHSVMSNSVTPRTLAHQAPLSMGILQATILEWVAMPSSRGYLPDQGLNSGLPHCRWILDWLSHQGNPRILEWVAVVSAPIYTPTSSAKGFNASLLIFCLDDLFMTVSGGTEVPYYYSMVSLLRFVSICLIF